MTERWTSVVWGEAKFSICSIRKFVEFISIFSWLCNGPEITLGLSLTRRAEGMPFEEILFKLPARSLDYTFLDFLINFSSTLMLNKSYQND